MSGRIRTIKPEWLDDELLAATSSDARVLSVALLLLADDYGNGRASVAALASEVWKFDMARDDGAQANAVVKRARDALAELEGARFVSIYEAAGQRYFAIRNWSKHQRVDKPGKPRVPGPDMAPVPAAARQDQRRVAYFVRGAVTGLVKIGESADPVARLVELAKAGSERLDLLAVGGVESDHHRALADDRVHGEWFRPSPAVLAKVREYGGNPESPIASAGYDGQFRTLATAPANVPDSLAKVPVDLATDLRSPISDLRPVPPTSERLSARSREGVEGAPESVTALAERNRRTVAEGYRSRGLAVPRQAASLAGTAEVAASLAGLPPDALPGILERFFGDARMREKGYPVAFLLTNANQWASAPRAHSAVSVPETDAERDADIDKLIAGAAWKPKREN